MTWEWIVFGIVGLVALWIYFVLAPRQKRQRNQNFDDLIEAFELRDVSVPFDEDDNMSFHRRARSGGMEIELYNKGETSFTNVSWSCKNPDNLTLKIKTDFNESFSTVKKVLGMQDIEVGIEEFDKFFIIQSNHKIFPVELFQEDICAEMLTLENKIVSVGGEFTLKDNYLIYKSPQMWLSSVEDYNRMVDVIELGAKLAARISNYRLPA